MEYNLLTLQLLYEGCTPENYPDYVQVDNSRLPGNNPLRNLGGGFVFKREYLDNVVFKTPCGLHVKGSGVLDNMSYYISWQPENNNPVLVCPFAGRKEFSCSKVHPFLKKEQNENSMSATQFCSCCRTDESYDYGRSIEKARADKDAEKRRLYEEFSDSKNGRVCINHMRFNEKEGRWEQRYDPETCANHCYSAFCPIGDRELNKKKGNVYYDVYRSGVYESGFIRQEWSRAEKGIRFFKKSVSIDICEAFLKSGAKERIEWRYHMEHSRERIFDESLKVEIKNIRAESRPHRDLQQDLLDIKEGRYVSWAPEEEKKKKEQKKQRRRDAAEKRMKKLEKKIITSGFDSLSEIEIIRAEKLLTPERILELKELHKEEMEKPVFEQADILGYI